MHHMDTRVDAPVQEAFHSDEISTFLVDKKSWLLSEPWPDIWYAPDIAIGEDWMQALYERVTDANWFLLLLPDSADDWGWQLYEAGIFRGTMLPGDRLICLHHPDVQRAPQLEDYQPVPAEQDAVIRFLEDILVKPNAVPGMECDQPARAISARRSWPNG